MNIKSVVQREPQRFLFLASYSFQIGVDKRILLWNIADGVPVIDLTGHTDAVYSLCFSRDGHILASGLLHFLLSHRGPIK